MNYPNILELELSKLIKQHPLNTQMQYSLLDGGKRFRGSLCYMVALTLGAPIDKVHSSSCALEMIHAYSLIHDDLPAMDDDDMRRGKPSSHKQFNEADAILTGDGLQSLAFNTIAQDKNLQSDIKVSLLQVLSKASLDMVLGQKLDIDSDENITLQKLENINKLKTGALLKASILMGGIIAGIDDKINNLLVNFADNLTLAYQVQDDLFDGLSVAQIGKSNNSDKTTFVDLLGVKKAENYCAKLYDNAIVELEKINNSNNLIELVVTMKNRQF